MSPKRRDDLVLHSLVCAACGLLLSAFGRVDTHPTDVWQAHTSSSWNAAIIFELCRLHMACFNSFSRLTGLLAVVSDVAVTILVGLWDESSNGTDACASWDRPANFGWVVLGVFVASAYLDTLGVMEFLDVHDYLQDKSRLGNCCTALMYWLVLPFFWGLFALGLLEAFLRQSWRVYKGKDNLPDDDGWTWKAFWCGVYGAINFITLVLIFLNDEGFVQEAGTTLEAAVQGAGTVLNTTLSSETLVGNINTQASQFHLTIAILGIEVVKLVFDTVIAMLNDSRKWPEWHERKLGRKIYRIKQVVPEPSPPNA